MTSTLSPQYIVGFTDGEGCFSLTMRRDVRHERKSKATYLSWKVSFAINLRADDEDLIRGIQNFFGCGSVTFSKNKTNVRYQVSNLEDLMIKIVTFFTENPLMGKKQKDFLFWKEAVEILYERKKLRGTVNIEAGKRGFQSVLWKEDSLEKLQELLISSSIYKSKTKHKWIDSGTAGRI